MSFNTDTNDWAAYRIYVIEEIKEPELEEEITEINLDEE